MVDIPEKMIDNLYHINPNLVLQKGINLYQIEGQVVGFNKNNSRYAYKRITEKCLKWNLVNK